MRLAALLALACACAQAAEPSDCQMKSAYVEFVISNRQHGLAEGQIPDLFGDKLDRGWKMRARHAIFTDANFAVADPMRMGEQVFRQCESANQPGRTVPQSH